MKQKTRSPEAPTLGYETFTFKSLQSHLAAFKDHFLQDITATSQYYR